MYTLACGEMQVGCSHPENRRVMVELVRYRRYIPYMICLRRSHHSSNTLRLRTSCSCMAISLYERAICKLLLPLLHILYVTRNLCRNRASHVRALETRSIGIVTCLYASKSASAHLDLHSIYATLMIPTLSSISPEVLDINLSALSPTNRETWMNHR